MSAPLPHQVRAQGHSMVTRQDYHAWQWKCKGHSTRALSFLFSNSSLSSLLFPLIFLLILLPPPFSPFSPLLPLLFSFLQSLADHRFFSENEMVRYFLTTDKVGSHRRFIQWNTVGFMYTHMHTVAHSGASRSWYLVVTLYKGFRRLST